MPITHAVAQSGSASCRAASRTPRCRMSPTGSPSMLDLVDRVVDRVVDSLASAAVGVDVLFVVVRTAPVPVYVVV